MLDGPGSRPWRKLLRFSVRGLIVFVIVIGAGLGWIVHQAHVQRDAVEAIKKAGGTIDYEWQWRDGNSIEGGEPRRRGHALQRDPFPVSESLHIPNPLVASRFGSPRDARWSGRSSSRQAECSSSGSPGHRRWYALSRLSLREVEGFRRP
jgi:hypothetical protein